MPTRYRQRSELALVHRRKYNPSLCKTCQSTGTPSPRIARTRYSDCEEHYQRRVAKFLRTGVRVFSRSSNIKNIFFRRWKIQGCSQHLWLNAWLVLRNRLVSRSFVTLFVVLTNLYLFDVFLEAYAKNTFSLELQQQISAVFGHGIVISIYLASVLEALVVSAVAGYVVARLRSKKANRNGSVWDVAVSEI